MRDEGHDPDPLERWFSEDMDVRTNPAVGEKVFAFLKEHAAKSVIVTDGIIGCPHEEGIDYPEGKSSTVKNFLPIRDNRLISRPIVQSWLSPPLSVHRSQLLVLNPEPVKGPSGLA